jgi:hypothetical protein
MKRNLGYGLALGVISALALVHGASAQEASGSTSTAEKLFAGVPGKGKKSLCFTRFYDAAHLKSHPDQNVTAMLLLVTAKPNAETNAADYEMSLGVRVRKKKTQYESSGYCSNGLHCGVECDGGSLETAIRDEKTILVSIPDRIRVTKPNDEEDAGVFWSDDKLFKLNKVALKDCRSLQD